MVTHAPGGTIAPYVPFATACHGVAQCFLPLYAVLVGCTFNDTSARPAHEFRMKILEHEGKVLALSVLATLECVAGEERHVVDHDCTVGIEFNLKFALESGSVAQNNTGKFCPVLDFLLFK